MLHVKLIAYSRWYSYSDDIMQHSAQIAMVIHTNSDFGASLECEVLIESEVRFVLAVNVSLDQPLSNRFVLQIYHNVIDTRFDRV